MSIMMSVGSDQNCVGIKFRNCIDLPLYDGRTSWRDFKIQFEMASALNRWDTREKMLHLGCSLRGLARNVLSDYDINVNTEYEELVMHLESRFDPAKYQDIYAMILRNRVQNPGESFSRLAYSILRLTKYAYPEASHSMIRDIAKEYFIDAITNQSIRRWVKYSMPRNLTDAIRIAIKVEVRLAVEMSKRRISASSSVVDQNYKPRCFRCKEKGHYRANCLR